MGRQVRDSKLGSREARSKLQKRHHPYWREIYQGLHVGYRKGEKGGVWIGRQYLSDGKYDVWRLGISDDVADADGENILSFQQADEKVRKGPLGRGAGGVKNVVDVMDLYMDYQKLEARSWKTTKYDVDRCIILFSFCVF